MTDTLELFRSGLREDGLVAALKVLNDTVEHRYTAIYRLQGAMLRNIALHDKLGEPVPPGFAEVGLQASFCQFVVRDGFFTTLDSGADDRLDGHPAKGLLVAYQGVPVHNRGGWLFGSLCHFDWVKREIFERDYQMLQEAARLLPPYLPD